ncbi:MAG: hypothetical protein NC095_07025 [Muribaculum sp.]|nr:hypothetical protein [Muribaculum sp.]
MKRLIADSGSTKTDWLKMTGFLNQSEESKTYTGLGLNPHILSPSEIEKELRRVRDDIGDGFDQIRFYGAGIGTPEMEEMMEGYLSNIFSCSDIKAYSDMEGAARAVLGENPGIACIMGTGSNSCHYDGVMIDRKASSLGYMLDDNGGGVAFGRRLLVDVFKNFAPPDIRKKFFETFNLSVPQVVDHLYRQPAPNKWIAGFMPFIVGYKEHPYVSTLIRSQLSIFFNLEFCSYPEAELKEEGIGFVGSVAYLLSKEIEFEAGLRGWKIRNILQKPLDKLLY